MCDIKMRRETKDMELTFQTVIIAAILLVTMIVIIAIYLGGIGGFKKFWDELFNKVETDADCLTTKGGPDDLDGDGQHDTNHKSDGTCCDPDSGKCTDEEPDI